MFVAKKDVTMQTKIHEALITSGKKKLASLHNIVEVHDTTSAAQVDSANDPKRSDHIHAISPTLSQTLSAIVAGFSGESSLSQRRFFPTKSAPTSAALV